jgi:hypothetical protein
MSEANPHAPPRAPVADLPPAARSWTLLMARAGAGTIGIMTLGFLYSSFFSLLALVQQPGTRATIELNVSIILHFLIAALFVYLTVRAYRRPTLLLCSAALICVLGDWAFEIWSMGLSDMFAKYWTQMLGTVLGVCAIRGAYLLRR